LLAQTSAFAAESETLLGEIDFPNSGAKKAQGDFVEGVLYLHNFEYDEAAQAFRRARETDPDFAMAYWGEAMTYNHSLWNRQSRASAEEALMRLGKTSEARAAKCGTQREKDYMRAVEILFGLADESKTLPKAGCDALYRDAMRAIHETYPDDDEATAFYGLSILGASGGRDAATYMRAAAVLTQAWDANRMHPGAAHYLIHCYDDPVHAPLGLPMARAYSKIAPSAAHAQHMTSHIFVAMGMWDDLVAANETATEIELAIVEGQPERTMEASHYVYWLHYGYLQQGRLDDARELLEGAKAKLEQNATSRAKTYYGAMYARYVLDGGGASAVEKFAVADDETFPRPHYQFARAFTAIQAGDFEQARKRVPLVQKGGDGNPEAVLDESIAAVLRKELEGMLTYAQGDKAKGLETLGQAADDASKLQFHYGPPQMTKPALELYGEVLLKEGKPAEAVAAFEKQLLQTPRRTSTLAGLPAAAGAAGDEVKSEAAKKQLAENRKAGGVTAKTD
jgi:tetratricopeptide (TPR) repeat protein